MGVKALAGRLGIVSVMFVIVTYIIYLRFPLSLSRNLRSNFSVTSIIAVHTLSDERLNKQRKSSNPSRAGVKSFSDSKSRYVDYETLVPQCDNILINMTQGQWIKRVKIVKYKDHTNQWVQQELILEEELHHFWVKRGIQTRFWRPDRRCGYKNFEQKPPNSTWPQVGSWCNARGKQPCCTDVFNGYCARPSKKTCECPSCVDLRKYIYADVSDWLVTDKRCQWRNYTAAQACDVIERSQINSIHFVGDSFSRNMFRAFAMLITNDTVSGAWHKNTSDLVKGLCTERHQFFWKECRDTLYNISEMYHLGKLCGNRGYANFKATMHPFYNLRFSAQFYDLVVRNLGVPGSLIIVSIGFHVGCLSEREINYYLGPAVNAIEQFYGRPLKQVDPKRLSGRWPQIILSLPLTIGLLKPTAYLNLQNEYKCRKYSRDMAQYAEMHDIRVLDFHPLTTLVQSFDGTHHGLAVNLMKNQILLNFIATLDHGLYV
ncbi:uncharacterized protein LOC120341178 isoform X2 [Styela clava]